MPTHMLEIPFAVDLTHENAWLQNNGEKYVYFVARLHLLVESSQYGNQTYPGEILAVYQTTRNRRPEQPLQLRENFLTPILMKLYARS
jgi:hypothetical protein